MANGKPIIMAVEGDAATLVTRARCGVTCEPENATALASAVLDLSSRSSSELEALGIAGMAYYLQKLCLKIGTDKFIKVFEELVNT